MSLQNLMNTVRQWDAKTSQWFFRHFYILFFQIILVGVFIAWFVNTLNVINQSTHAEPQTTVETLLISSNINGILIVFLLILNSFWMLILLTSVFKMRALLKNIDFSLSRRSTDRRLPPENL